MYNLWKNLSDGFLVWKFTWNDPFACHISFIVYMVIMCQGRLDLICHVIMYFYCQGYLCFIYVNKKRFYTRRTLRSFRILRLAKSQTLILIGWYPWSKKRVNYLSCIEGKVEGVVKIYRVVHKKLRYLLIYYNISFVIMYSYCQGYISLFYVCYTL